MLPLFKIPLLPIFNILSLMNGESLLHLSLLSEFGKEVARRSRRNVKVDQKCGGAVFELTFEDEQVFVNSQQICSLLNKSTDPDHVLDHLHSMFNVEKFVRRYTDSETLSLEPADWSFPISELHVSSIGLTRKEAEFLLHENPNISTISLNVKSVDFSEKYSLPLITKHLQLSTDSWLSIDALLNMKCEELLIMSCRNNISAFHLNQLLKKWLNATSPSDPLFNLKRFGMVRGPFWESNNIDEILMDIPRVERGRMDNVESVKGEFTSYPLQGSVLIRRNDGLIASITREHHFYFSFVVRNDLMEI